MKVRPTWDFFSDVVLATQNCAIEPGGLDAFNRRVLEERPGPAILITQFHAVSPIGAVR